MREYIGKLANESAHEIKVDRLLAWLQTFDVKSMARDSID